MILVFQLNKEYMIGLTQEPNDDGRREGGRDRVKFRDAIASKNLNFKIWLTGHSSMIQSTAVSGNQLFKTSLFAQCFHIKLVAKTTFP